MREIILLTEADAATTRYKRALKMAANAKTPEEKQKYEAEAQKWNELAGKANVTKQVNAEKTRARINGQETDSYRLNKIADQAKKWTASKRLEKAEEIDAQRKDANSKTLNYDYTNAAIRRSSPGRRYIPQKGVDAIQRSRENANIATGRLLQGLSDARSEKTGTEKKSINPEAADDKVFDMTKRQGFYQDKPSLMRTTKDVLSDEKRQHRSSQRGRVLTREMMGTSDMGEDEAAFKKLSDKAREKIKPENGGKGYYKYLGVNGDSLWSRNRYNVGRYGVAQGKGDYMKVGASGDSSRGHAKNQTP